VYGKKLSENQTMRLIDKGGTTNLKGFKINDNTTEGSVHFDDDFKIQFSPKKQKTSGSKSTLKTNEIPCPKCATGTILKGKTAYGCSHYKQGCNFMYSFAKLREKSNGQPLTKELVLEILNT
jgi:DNA topoisomerase-3